MKGIISQKSALKELLKRIKKYWFLLAASMIFASVYVVLSLYIPRLIGLGTDQIIARGNVNFQELKNVIVEILVCTAIAAVSWWIMGLCNNRITYNVIRDIRQEAFCTIQKLPVRYMDSRSTGDIVNNVITDVDQLADGLLMGFSNLFTGVLTIFITLVSMENCSGCYPDYTCIFLCGRIYCETNLLYVSETVGNPWSADRDCG